MGGQCVLVITPGQTSSATPGAVPNPSTLTIFGINTNILAPTVEVLTYGNQYQSGYVFAVDDMTPNTGSIGGKVAGLTDESGGIIWSSNGTAGNVSYDIIPWIGQTSSLFCLPAKAGSL